MNTFLLFFILFISALVSAKKPCTPSCGDVNISYPFHLKGDPSYCGNPDPNYELTCNSRNQTILNLFSLDYKVTQISYNSDRCRIDVTDVTMPVNGTCRIPFNSLSASKLETSPYYIQYFNNWDSIVNCTKEVNNNSMYIPVPCLSRNNTFIYIVDSPGYSVGYLVSSCSYLAMGPTGYFDDLCMKLASSSGREFGRSKRGGHLKTTNLARLPSLNRDRGSRERSSERNSSHVTHGRGGATPRLSRKGKDIDLNQDFETDYTHTRMDQAEKKHRKFSNTKTTRADQLLISSKDAEDSSVQADQSQQKNENKTSGM
ncbi:hypothetical protein J5N97_007481 [Dioscorea zingiberensis]|uniref:RING-type E3 ubiquitin transferase n=1 Tax=Dioscorea zingiberensis TaxID=325984 RepID=A0A9D5DE61_9LILI|nr:hypothetical protein J5N97_007481 [Dioscorea zingiberensis]